MCEVPYGSYPCNMPYEYFSDEAHFCAWLEAEREMSSYQTFLDQYLFGVTDFNGYLTRCGGLARMQQLRREELLLDRGL